MTDSPRPPSPVPDADQDMVPMSMAELSEFLVGAARAVPREVRRLYAAPFEDKGPRMLAMYLLARVEAAGLEVKRRRPRPYIPPTSGGRGGGGA